MHKIYILNNNTKATPCAVTIQVKKTFIII